MALNTINERKIDENKKKITLKLMMSVYDYSNIHDVHSYNNMNVYASDECPVDGKGKAFSVCRHIVRMKSHAIYFVLKYSEIPLIIKNVSYDRASINYKALGKSSKLHAVMT